MQIIIIVNLACFKQAGMKYKYMEQDICICIFVYVFVYVHDACPFPLYTIHSAMCTDCA